MANQDPLNPPGLRRFIRWLQEIDPRVQKRFWTRLLEPGVPDTTAALCPVCGTAIPLGESAPTDLMSVRLSEGPAQDAYLAGGIGFLALDLPIQAGELWYMVCPSCRQADPTLAQAAPSPWLKLKIDAMVEEALAVADV